ncbi:hypothetical protein AcV5_008025 [Taiwanofungus camphoratus]|nr:hypothetical protein AcV5_008025 [Antrodia cinnamomea]KAI0930790.1 hypothetical protein AcV7_004881 [Antrodia cinnamomea]
MQLTPLAVVLISVFCPSLGLSTAPNVNRPFELVVHHAPGTFECSFVSLRETQKFRRLSHQGHSDVSSALSGEEQLRFIDLDVDNLWHRARMLCGSETSWNFTVFLDPRNRRPTDTENAQNVLTLSEAPNQFNQAIPPPLQVEPLIGSGHPSNRVDLVFFSDGYTTEERGKFIADANRLAMDISGNQTFNTVKPLLNFWAAFVPSNESGIGTGGQPKDTPFGLYRDGTELRGVYYSKPEVARAACYSLGDKCDYPILMGNDPLYGGLGGEFTVITPSLANGALVLRHELGHSIIGVGEEYDGGYAYFGVDAAHNLSEPIPWSHWLTNASSYPQHAPSHDHNSMAVRVERSVMPMQAYAWTLLNVSEPWSIKFNSSGSYSRHLVRFSLSGLPEEDDLTVELDGEHLLWTPRDDIGVDRWHYDVHRNQALGDGEHELKFKLNNKNREGVAQLCSAEVLEFGDQSEFVATPGHYGVFPTFSEKNETSYRPTNEDCLMRIVTTPNFCKVCLEGLWLSLLRRVDLIDDMHAGCEWEHPGPDVEVDIPAPLEKGKWKRIIGLDLVPLAQFREEAAGVHESYVITWAKDGQILESFTNKTMVEVDDEIAYGTYSVDVSFTTAEVRVDKEGLLQSRREYVVSSMCGA